MTDLPVSVTQLVERFEQTYRDHMEGLPIVNSCLQVEAVAFRDFDGHELGVLITPWFMNLVLLPRGEKWRNCPQGDNSTIEFPCGPIEFMISQDDLLGTFLTVVLFRSVLDMTDQSMARAIAEQVMEDLFVPARDKHSLSRRELLTGIERR